MDGSLLDNTELRDILREISEQVDGPIRPDYIDSLDSIGIEIFVSRFGSLAQASLEAGCEYETDKPDPDVYAAGLSETQRNRRQQLIEDLVRIVQNLEYKPSTRNLKVYGRDISAWKIQEFGSFTAVVLEAGLDPDDIPGYISPKEFTEELQRLANQIGAAPSRDFVGEQGQINLDTYDTRFPTWDVALESAGLDPNGIDTRGEIVRELELLAGELGHRPNEDEIELYTGIDLLDVKWMFGSIEHLLDTGEIPPKRELIPSGSLTRPPNATSDIPSHTDLLREVFTLRRRSETTLETPESQQEAFDRRGIIDEKHYDAQFGSVSEAFEYAENLDARSYSERRDERVRDIPMELLAEYAQELADILERRPLVDEVVTLTDASLEAYIEEFDSWDSVFETELIGGNKETSGEVIPTNSDILEDLERVGTYVERPPTYEDIRDVGYYPVESVLRRFGSWPAALNAVGVEISPDIPSEYFAGDLTQQTIYRSQRLREEQFDYEAVLRDDLHRIALDIGRVPTWEDIETFGAYPITDFKQSFSDISSVIDDPTVETHHINGLQSGEERSQLTEDLARVDEYVDGKVWPRDIAFFGYYTLPSYLGIFGTLEEAYATAGLETDHLPQTVSQWAEAWDEKFPDAKSFLSTLRTQYEKTGEAPTMAEINESGGYAQRCYEYYDTWEEALIIAGIPPERRSPRRSASKEQLLTALRELADEIGYPPKTNDVKEYGEFGLNSYYNYWSSWQDALAAAGLIGTQTSDQSRDSSETDEQISAKDGDSDVLDQIIADIEGAMEEDG